MLQHSRNIQKKLWISYSLPDNNTFTACRSSPHNTGLRATWSYQAQENHYWWYCNKISHKVLKECFSMWTQGRAGKTDIWVCLVLRQLITSTFIYAVCSHEHKGLLKLVLILVFGTSHWSCSFLRKHTPFSNRGTNLKWERLLMKNKE